MGTHLPSWLAKLEIPLFVSHRQLRKYRTLPVARGPWALDSGAFTEISMYGRWQYPIADYVRDVQRFQQDTGRMEWAAIQDWMCEPHMLEKTGLTVEQHQDLTVDSLVALRSAAPEVPWAPVLQGWAPDEHVRHWEKYEARGIVLEDEKIVGVGSVCRRGHTQEIVDIARSLQPLRIHGFGVKMHGAKVAANYFTSTDSLAWSFAGRRDAPLPGHEVRHKNCANCMEYALIWREKLLGKITSHMEAA
jgi:hypothetical protein